MLLRDIKPWTQNMSGPREENEPYEPPAKPRKVRDPETGRVYRRDSYGIYSDESGVVVDPELAARLDREEWKR